MRLPFRAPVRRVTLPLADRADRSAPISRSRPAFPRRREENENNVLRNGQMPPIPPGIGERDGRRAGDPMCLVSLFPGKPRKADRRPEPPEKRSKVTGFGQNMPGRWVDAVVYGNGNRARRRSERAPVVRIRTVRTTSDRACSCPCSSGADILPMLSSPPTTELVETSGVWGRANPPSPGTPGFLSARFLLLSRRQTERKARRRCFYRVRSLRTPLTFRT